MPDPLAMLDRAWPDAGSGLADKVSSLSSLTKLTLHHAAIFPIPGLGEAGMLDALRQLSALQALRCPNDVMQTLLVNSVPRSWSLLTELQFETRVPLSTFRSMRVAPDFSLVEQQCPQLQALATFEADPLCLTALTSLTCHFWLPRDRDQFQCSRLGHLHVLRSANISILPSTLTSLSLDYRPEFKFPVMSANLQGRQQLSYHPSLVHICFTSQLEELPQIRSLLPAVHYVLAKFVTSVQLNIHPEAFIPPVTDRRFCQYLGAWFSRLQRLHIHLHMYGKLQAGQVLISAAWLPAHRLVVTHRLKCPVRVVQVPSGCLSLPLSLRPADAPPVFTPW